MRKILLLALSIFSFLAAFAQVDTEFWFAVPHLSEHTNDASYHLIVFTKDIAADVSISMPAEPSFLPINRHVDADGYQDILIASDYTTAQGQIVAQIGNITTHGLLIQSTTPIYCYFLITGVNGEAYTLKGKKALGEDFYILSQNTLVNGTSANKYREAYHTIQIVATENNTEVTYAPTQNVGAPCESSTHTITLQKGETFAFRACSKDAAGHLVGTYITSTKPIVVNSTDDSVFVPGSNGKDLAGDQLTPTDYWGTEYIAIGNGSNYETLTIVAKQNNTHISFDDGISFTLNGGEVLTISMGASLTKHIQSDKPIGVWQMTGQTKEPGGTNLPCLTCTGSSVVKYKRIPGSMETFIHIITLTSNSAHFTLNGSPVSQSEFHEINGTNSQYSYASIDISNVGVNVVEVKCSTGLFHMAAIDNYTNDNIEISSCTYGYFSDYGTAHEYDEYDTFDEGSIYTWPNHYKADGITPQIFTDEGIYKDTLTDNNGCDSICVLHLSKIPYPDNVDDATGCMVPPGTNVWSIRQKAISEVSNIDDSGTTFCGDIDGDGQVEILAPIITDDVKFSKIGIFNSQAKAKRIIDVPTCSAFINIAIAKVKVSDSDYRTLIFFLAYDRYLYAYDPNGSQFWKSDQQFTSHSGEAVAIASLSLADFNHDGWTEIYIGPEIFDAATGKRLAKYNGNKGHSDRAWKASRQSYQSVVADVVGDDRLELILGNTACSVNINSRTNETLNSITAVNSVPAANMKMEDNSNIPSTDGHTLLADMDGDGKLDVVVMHIDKTNRIIYIYVWNPRTGSMICTKKITDAAEFGTPNVGDIDHDGNLELNFIIGTYSGETTDANDKIYSLKYNKSTHNLEVFWTLHHDDASGSTGLSLFDFNQDGTMEIVYRDCEHLRIINGSMIHHITGNPVAAPYDLANIPCTSGTGVEYPVIADVDADGEAEIIVGGNGSKLVIYESDLAPWAPARSVWNQFAYNITNVNEDLTIPTYLYNNAHIFTDVSSTTRQPFNNFLAQTTTINTQGVPFIAAADVNVSTTTSATYENDSIKIDISFCNQGDLQVNAPYCITVYKNAYRGSVLFVDTIKAILPIGDCLSHQVGFPISNVCSNKDINSIVIAVNDDGHGIAQHGNQQAECDTTNNSTSVSLPTDFRSDTTKYTPVICATELPYTFTPTGTIFPVGTTSGRTIIPETNKYGCDSIITIDLTVNPTLTGDTTATFCNGTPFIWHETSYPTGGDYPYIYTSKVSGCDSIVTLHLTQLEPTDSVENVTLCAGGTHTWHGQTFTSSTTITETIPNAAGCDSVCMLNLTILPALTGDTSATFCSGKSFTWHGTQYAISGHYPYTYTSKVAPYCDSIVTLYLTQLEPTDSVENVTLCYGESHVWHGQTFTTSTTITETIPNAAGCDSVCTLKLTVLPALTGDTSATFCNGTPFIWHDTPYATGGDYQYTYTSKVAPYCDSIVTLHLTQLEPTDSIEVVTICYGGSHTWHGHTYTTTTTTTETIDNAVGCDSVCTLKLTVLPALTGDTTATFCKDHSFIWHGTPYSTEGHYPYTYTSKVTGCDSIVTLHLTQLEPTDSVEIVTICYGETHTWHEDTYSTSTTKTITIPNTVGCDSVCTLQLTILPKLTGDTSAIFCNGTPFIWHGMPYATGGDYQYTYTSKVAPYCDSLVTLHLTQLEPTDSIENVTICSGATYTWHGQTFTTSTTKTITIDNAVGCDSVCTLNLTVLPALTGDTAATVCAGGSFTWWDNTLSASGTCTHTYQSPTTGCDSIVTLTLTVLPVLTGTTTATITEGATYTWNGQPYSAEGDYTQTLTTDAGCDSIVTLRLKVNPLIYDILMRAQCADDPFVEFELQADDGLIHQLQFAFSQKALDQHFRDTTVTITTSLIQIPNSARAGIYDVAISPIFDQQLLDTRNYQFTLLYPSSVLDQHWDDFIGVLTNPYNGGYDFIGFQWYKNGSPITGENHSYLYQPLEMGSPYSAMLEEADGTKLMTCEIIATPQTEISLYPTLLQPRQIIRLHSSEDVTIWLYDSLGKLLYTNSFERGDSQFAAPQDHGIYIVKIQQTGEKGKSETKKLIVR